MKFLLVLFMCCTLQAAAQPSLKKCYFVDERAQISYRMILFPVADSLYAIELYSYGNGVFWGPPQTDTVKYVGDNTMKSESLTIRFTADKMVVKNAAHKRLRFHYKELDICASEINYTRNHNFYEQLRVTITDREKGTLFHTATKGLMNTCCYEDFARKAMQIKTQLDEGKFQL